MRVHLPKLVIFIALIFIVSAAKAQAPTISYSPSTQSYTDGTTIATWSPTTGGGAATGAYSIPFNYQGLPTPYGVAVGKSGNIYAVDNADMVLYQYTAAGATNVIDGNNLFLPTSVTIDTTNNVIYVADASNISKYNLTTGALIIQIADGGDNAQDIALDAAGNAYILNQDGTVFKLLKGATSYTPLLTGFSGSSFGIAVNGTDIYVSQYSTNSIIKVANGTSGGTTKTTFATGFSSPSHMTFDAAGNLYVADNGNNAIKEISPAGVVSTFISGLNGPLGVAFDSASPHPDLFETDNGGAGFINESSYVNYSINAPLPDGLVFNTSTGAITGTPDEPSNPITYTVTAYNASGTGSFPITISVTTPPPVISYTPPGGNFLVGTALPFPGNKITPVNTGGTVHSLGFSTTGTPLTGGSLLNPLNMTTDAAGNVYVADPNNGTVQKYNSSGVSVGTIGSGFTTPNGIVFDTNGNAYVVDHGGASGATAAVYKITPGGTQTTILNVATGFLAQPWAIAIDGSNNLYVANNGGQNITEYDTTGNRLLTVKGKLTTPYNAASIPGPVGVVVDGSGNIYVLDYNRQRVNKYNSNGTFLSTFGTTTLYNPLGLAIDADGDIYVVDEGAGGASSNTGTVNVYSPSGTMFFQLTGLHDPKSATIDSQGNLYVNDYSGNSVSKYPPIAGYFINKPLPAGLSFNSTTGAISGTPTAVSPSTVYTITAYNTGGSGSTTVTISCYATYDWIGTTSTAWLTTTNWSSGIVPTAGITANIGVNVAFTNQPLITVNATVGAIQFGSTGGKAPTLTVTGAAIALTVTGAITNQSDTNSPTSAFNTSTLAGTGTINAGSLNVIANTATGSYTQAIASSITKLNVTGNVALTSSNNGAAKFNITGGTTTVTGVLQSTNTSSGTSTFAFTGATATLQLNNAAALSGLSATGTNVVTFNAAGATVNYGGTAQTIYTDGSITGLPGGVSYQNITFSGSGIKTVSTGNLTVAGNFTNTLANNASNYIDFSNATANFNGTAQIITSTNAGTKFYNVSVSGVGTKIITGSMFNIASSGVLTMTGAATTILNANGFLTLNSDATGSATVAALNGPKITNSVSVQRYITGNMNPVYRGYRLLSSPVNATNVSPYQYSINYVQLSCYITGATGGGFDVPATTNPTLYLFREDLTPSNASFTGGNFWGFSKINNSPNYNYNLNGTGTISNLTPGSGFMLFFRGDRAVAPITTEAVTTYVPTSTTLTATGYLNQGSFTVRPWYTGASTLGFSGTGTGTNYAVRGFNLVGNPYASSINWDTYGSGGIVSAGSPIGTSMYILDPVSKNYSVYAAGGGGGGTIALTQANIIPSGQGFFVIATSATSTLTFNESAKVNTQATAGIGNLFLTTQPIASKVNQSLHLMLKKDTSNIDGLFINFNDGAKSTFDLSKDAPYKIGNGIASLSSRSADSIALAINTLALPKKGQTVIGLNVSAKSDGVYALSMQSIKSLPAIYEVWLKDAYKNDSLDMRANPTYSFNVINSDKASFGSNRFSLVIRQNAALAVQLLNFTATKASTGVQTVWTTQNEQNYTNFTVERSTDNGATFEVLGGLTSSGLGTYSLVDKEPLAPADQYRLKVQDLDGNISYSNVVTLLYSNQSNNIVKNGVSIYPNPASGIINLAITKTTGNAALYGIEIVNNRGTIIKSATSTQPTWQSDVSGLLPGSYIVRVVNNTDGSLVARGTFIKL